MEESIDSAFAAPQRTFRLGLGVERKLDAREWALRALLAALTRPESKAARERRSREVGFALLSLLAGRPPTETRIGQERGSHA